MIKKSLNIESMVSITIRLLGALSAYFLTYFIAKTFKLDLAGEFFFFLSIIFVTSSILRVGLDNVVLKETSLKNHSGTNSYSIIKAGFLISIIVSFALLMPFYFTFQILDKSEHALIVYSMVVVYTFIFLNAMILQGESKTIKAVFILNISMNLLAVSFIKIFDISTLSNLLSAYLAALFITLVISIIFNKNILSKTVLSNPLFMKTLKTSIPLLIFALCGQLQIWFGQFVLGMLASPSEVATYTVYHRVAMMLTFILVAVNIIVAPKIARLVNLEKHFELKTLIKKSNTLIILITIPICLCIFVFQNEIFLLFGGDYGNNMAVFYILILGQIFNVFTGSVGYLLSMSNNENDLKRIAYLVIPVLVIFIFPLTLYFGEFGTAISASTALILQNLLAAYFVHKRLDINVFNIIRK